VTVSMETVQNPTALRAKVDAWRRDGKTIALVPTMGALHDGHLDLVRAAKHSADMVVTSIFVNPTQFGANEDLDRYPKTMSRDTELLTQTGCDLLYAPTKADMYPHGFGTTVSVSQVTGPLEGQFRPHFFAGVATIVAKLFIQCDPDLAIFGEKDWQQLQVVTKMARDLDLRVAITGVATRRERDGLAMSSRNAYLSPEERAQAPALKRALDQICDAISTEVHDGDLGIGAARDYLLAQGFKSIDYLAACHAQTLEPWQKGDPLRVLGAAWMGTTRLIDNRGA
jgi:pantoate--beta-alanine ligase